MKKQVLSPRETLCQSGLERFVMNVEVFADADSVAWDLVQTFLAAEFSQAERHLPPPRQSGLIGNDNRR